MILIALVSLMGLMMIASALLALHARSLLTAVIAVGILSLFSSVIYLVLQAPDVAMTEAAIGAGLSTVIFLYAIKKTAREEVDDD